MISVLYERKRLRFFISTILLGIVFCLSLYGGSVSAAPPTQPPPCPPTFMGLPTWYAYLDGADTCNPTIDDPIDFALIGLAVIDILMRVAAMLSVIFLVVGGIKYTTSQGSPDGTQNAKNTIVFSLIGLVITIFAAGAVSWVARVLGS